MENNRRNVFMYCLKCGEPICEGDMVIITRHWTDKSVNHAICEKCSKKLEPITMEHYRSLIGYYER